MFYKEILRKLIPNINEIDCISYFLDIIFSVFSTTLIRIFTHNSTENIFYFTNLNLCKVSDSFMPINTDGKIVKQLHTYAYLNTF